MSENKKILNPFPGLRPFEASEQHLFFGRENQIEELRKKLHRTHFLAVVGTSGSGKSSLLRAGFLPTLLNNDDSTPSAWRVATMRPGNDPIGNLASALNSPQFWRNEKLSEGHGQFTETALRHGSMGLVETIKDFRVSENILILVDQFEELFRFIDSGSKDARDDASKFVKLILESSYQREMPIYIALTMRSDYLGDCPQFRDLPEAINDSQYLIPRLTRNQTREAIRGPIHVAGGEISSRLLSKILNSITDSQDQLPVLQHALMRTFGAWSNNPVKSDVIDLVHYKEIGGMEDALSQHANEIYDTLSDTQKLHAATLFKSLTEIDSDARVVRRPCALGEISSVAKSTDEEIIKIVDAFRAPGRSFIMPPHNEDLSHDSVLDISHESLMRGWKRLKTWIKEERDSSKTYQRLAQSAVLYNTREAGVLRNPGLDVALEWRKKQSPTEDWAKRYNPNFNLSIKYLEKSQKREFWARLLKIGGFALGLLTVAAIIFSIVFWDQKEDAIKLKEDAEIARKESDSLKEIAVSKSDSVTELLVQVDSARIIEAEQRELLEIKRDSLNSILLEVIEANKLAEYRLGELDVSKKEAALLSSFPDSTQQSIIIQELLALKGNDEAYYTLRRSYQLAAKANNKLADYYYNEDYYYDSEPTDTLLSNAYRIAESAYCVDSNEVTKDILDEITSVVINENTLKDTIDPKVLFKGHSGQIFGVTISPDGSHVLTGSADGTAKLWDMNGHNIRTFHGHNGHTGAIFGVAFSPGGDSILTGSFDSTAKIWDIEGEVIRTLHGHSERLLNVTFSADGDKILTASFDSTAILWDLHGNEIQSLTGHSNLVYDVAMSPDGTRVLTGSSDNTAKLWNLHGNEIRAFFRDSYGIYSVAFSPDGEFILLGNSIGYVELWDFEGNERFFVDYPGDNGPYDVAFSPVGEMLVSLSLNGVVSILDFNGNIIGFNLIRVNPDGVYSMDISPDNKYLLAGMGDSIAGLWDFNELSSNWDKQHICDNLPTLSFQDKLSYETINIQEVLVTESHSNLLTGARYYRQKCDNEKVPYLKHLYSNYADTVAIQLIQNIQYCPDCDGKLKAYSYIYKLDLEDSTKLLTLREQLENNDKEYSLFVREQQWMSELSEIQQEDAFIILAALQGQDNEYFKIRRSLYLAAMARALSDSLPVTALRVAHKAKKINDNIITKSVFNNILDMKPAIGKTFFTGQMSGIQRICFSADGKRLLTMSDYGEVKIWDLDGNEISTFHTYLDEVDKISFSPDGNNVLAIGDYGTFNIWNIDGNVINTFDDYLYDVTDFNFSTDGRYILAFHYSGDVHVWDFNGNEISLFNSQLEYVTEIFFSPDSKSILALDEYGEVKVWDLNGDIIASFSIGSETIDQITFSPDGTYILTNSYYGDFTFWDLSGNIVSTFDTYLDYVDQVIFSPDSKSILVLSEYGEVQLWDLNGTLISTIDSYMGYFSEIIFSPDGTTIITGSEEGIVRIWDLGGREVQSFNAHTNSIVYALDFSPDGKLLLTIGGDGALRLWDIENLQVIDEEKDLSTNELVPYLSFSEKLKYETIELDEVLATDNELNLLAGAEYLREMYLNTNQEYLKNEYSSSATSVYQLILNEKRQLFTDSTLAMVYADFAMLKLLEGNYSESIALAESGYELEIKPPKRNFSVWTIGRILYGQLNEKEINTIYLNWKKQNGPFPESFINDVLVVKNHGVERIELEGILEVLLDGSNKMN